MSRKGSVNFIVLLFFLISLVLGALSGIYKALNSHHNRRTVEEEEILAVPAPHKPAPNVSLPGKAEPKKTKRETYVIGGIGRKGVVTVDLPEEKPISVDKPDKKREITIKLPPQLEDAISEAKEHVDTFDEATRRTVKTVIESLNVKGAEPDKATIRPSEGGVQLKVSIPVGKD